MVPPPAPAPGDRRRASRRRRSASRTGVLDAQGARAAPVQLAAATTSCARSTTSRSRSRRGEFFGIVGRNGSGKSTLLKCLAGIYNSDSGDVTLEGRLSPFIELGVGFNPELTARDNVLLNAIMLGLTRKQARDRFDEHHRVRRARGVRRPAAEELLERHERAAGVRGHRRGRRRRAADRRGARRRRRRVPAEVLRAVRAAQARGAHDRARHARHVRGRALLRPRDADRPRQRARRSGGPHEIALAYNELNFGRLVDAAPSAEGRYGDRAAAEIKAAWFEDDAGERIKDLPQGEPVHDLRWTSTSTRRWRSPSSPSICATSRATSSSRPRRRGGRSASATSPPARPRACSVRFDNWLAPNRYTVSPSVARAGTGDDLVDLREDLASVRRPRHARDRRASPTCRTNCRWSAA